MSVYRTFKGTERAIARILGAKRTGQFGGADVTGDWLVAEVKHRQSVPAWLRAAVTQAQRNAGELQLPIAVIHEQGGRHDEDLVVMTLKTWLEWFGPMEAPTDEH